MSVRMKIQMARMMGKSIMSNVLRDFGRDRKLVLCLAVRIRRRRFSILKSTRTRNTVCIWWIGSHLTRTV